MASRQIAHLNTVRAFTLSPQMNTDRTQITSLCNPVAAVCERRFLVAASLREARLKISLMHVQRRPQGDGYSDTCAAKFSVLARTSQSRLPRDRVRRSDPNDLRAGEMRAQAFGNTK